MEPVSANITVNRTARYFLLGNDKQPVEQILFVLHGYGMQADVFLSRFKCLIKPGTLIVAPEGLSRFYRRGFSGEVAASWMTKADRHHEISDYIGYLDRLYDHLVTPGTGKVLVLGFSQGATTASRWVMTGNRKTDALVLWAGEFAQDIAENNSGIKTIHQVIGSSDEFISMEKFQNQSLNIEKQGFKVINWVFEGGHEIEEQTLAKVWSHLLNQP